MLPAVLSVLGTGENCFCLVLSAHLCASHYPLTVPHLSLEVRFKSFKRTSSCFSDSDDVIYRYIHRVSVTSIMHCKMARWHFEKSTGQAVSISGPTFSFIIYKLLTF